MAKNYTAYDVAHKIAQQTDNDWPNGMPEQYFLVLIARIEEAILTERKRCMEKPKNTYRKAAEMYNTHENKAYYRGMMGATLIIEDAMDSGE